MSVLLVGHAACNFTAVDDDDGITALAEFIGGRNACNARSDHHNVASRVAVERASLGNTSTSIQSDLLRIARSEKEENKNCP